MDYKKLGEVISLEDLSILGDAELQLLRETVNDVIKARRNETAAIIKATLKEGMEVSVDHPKDYKDKINAYLKSVNESEALSIHDVSEMFKFAGYLYGNFDYYDNTEDGDIYIHNDNGLKYTREKVYQQWIGIRNSR